MHKLVCDGMFGSLAKWMRFLGFDCLYAGCVLSDDDIVIKAQSESRVVITRDKLLVRRCGSLGVEVILVESDVLEDQIVAVLKRCKWDEDALFSRCSVCNAMLVEVDKQKVWNRVPVKVFESHDVFWKCPVCLRMYWMGTHYEQMKKTVDELKKAVSS